MTNKDMLRENRRGNGNWTI